MGRGLNSARLRRQKRRLRPRVQKPRQQLEVSGHQRAPSPPLPWAHASCLPGTFPLNLWVLLILPPSFSLAFVSILDTRPP